MLQSPNGSDSESKKKQTAISNFMPQILSDDEIVKGINSLNSKQREVFSVVHTWSKDYVKYDKHVELVYIFLSGSGGTGKSHLVNIMGIGLSTPLSQKHHLFFANPPLKPANCPSFPPFFFRQFQPIYWFFVNPLLNENWSF